MAYAYIDAFGNAVEVLPNTPFATAHLRVAADEAEHYAIPAGTVITQTVQHGPFALAEMTTAELDRFQIQEVADAELPPAGQMMATRTLVVTNGIIGIHATYAPIPLAPAQAQQLAAVQVQYDTHRQSPMAWNFGAVHALDDAGADKGAPGVQHLQMDDASAADWLAVTQTASLLTAGGNGATVLPLRVQENVWLQTTAAEVLQIFATGDGTQNCAFQRQLAMRRHFAALKAQIAAAADGPTCMAIDVTAGWPA